MNNKLIALFIGIATISCSGNSSDEPEGDKPGEEEGIQVAEGIDGTRISWESTPIIIRNSGTYGRVKELNDGRWAAVFESNGGYISYSKDKGQTWSTPELIFETRREQGVTVNQANPELIQLSTGELLYAIDRRPAEEGVIPWGIAIRRSTDLGKTWSEEQIIYEAGKTGSNGCWEPYFLELPNGSVQCYFANEGPYTASSEQEISVLTSADKGLTWSNTPAKASFRANFRDGMPTACIFGDNIVMAIEDNADGNFKPYTIRTSLTSPWASPVLSDSPERMYALSEKLQSTIYAGAPYITKLPTGEALLTFQSTEGRFSPGKDPLTYCTIDVAIGDTQAKNFNLIDRPFAADITRGLWPSISVLDDCIVASVADVNGVNLKRGLLRRDMSSDGKSIVMAADSRRLCKATVKHESGKLIVDCNLFFASAYSFTAKDNYLTIYIDSENNRWTKPSDGCFKVRCNLEGSVQVFNGVNGEWEEANETNATASFTKSDDNTYKGSIAIPFSNTSGTARIAVEMENRFSKTITPLSDSLRPYTWCKLSL